MGGVGVGGAPRCGALRVEGFSCPSVWQAANHVAGKQCHFSSVCQRETERGGEEEGGGYTVDVRQKRGGVVKENTKKIKTEKARQYCIPALRSLQSPYRVMRGCGCKSSLVTSLWNIIGKA